MDRRKREQFKLRVLCFIDEGFERKTLAYVTKRYNQRYPPLRIGGLLGFKLKEQRIREIIDALVRDGLVEMFTISEPENDFKEVTYFAATCRGRQRLGAKR